MPSKAYFIIRSDLDMPQGKLAAQVGHGVDSIWTDMTIASVSVRGANASHEKPHDKDIKTQNDFSTWVQDGRRKIVMKTKSETTLQNLMDKLKSQGYNVKKIMDHGFNHFDGLTWTGIVVFPCAEEIESLKRVRLW